MKKTVIFLIVIELITSCAMTSKKTSSDKIPVGSNDNNSSGAFCINDEECASNMKCTGYDDFKTRGIKGFCVTSSMQEELVKNASQTLTIKCYSTTYRTLADTSADIIDDFYFQLLNLPALNQYFYYSSWRKEQTDNQTSEKGGLQGIIAGCRYDKNSDPILNCNQTENPKIELKKSASGYELNIKHNAENIQKVLLFENADTPEKKTFYCNFN